MVYVRLLSAGFKMIHILPPRIPGRYFQKRFSLNIQTEPCQMMMNKIVKKENANKKEPEDQNVEKV